MQGIDCSSGCRKVVIAIEQLDEEVITRLRGFRESTHGAYDTEHVGNGST